MDGTGQTIGLLEFDTYQTSDVSDFLTLLSAPPAQIGNLSNVHVNGGASPGPNQAEVLLDIDTVMTLAPAAKVVVYDAPFGAPGASFQELFNAMIDGGVDVISNSWAYCEDQTTAADVNSIDTILQSAAASGISVFNGAGDTGSTCLDGSPNTVAVPADSPSASAVGGTTVKVGEGYVYGSEIRWNGSGATPPSGQSGFGVSQFFSRPAYQDKLNPSAMRSVPDVVIDADPATGTVICQAGHGGCPSGLVYGGTSMSAPMWAAYTALLNDARGADIGAFNPAVYPFANTAGFHNAASMGSDFAHVGLGSPNLDVLLLELLGISVGPVSTADSAVTYSAATVSNMQMPPIDGVPADGTAAGTVTVTLSDANGDSISGKSVALSANGGSSAKITPASGITSVNNGAVSFQVTDLIPEAVTLTAQDTTDHVTLPVPGSITFGVPSAAAAGLDAFPATVSADGKISATITVTLKDSLGRPTPGKLVMLSQGSGKSVIKGPNPAATNASGQMQFTVVDQIAETVTYSAMDITDGNLPFPTTGTVTFTGGPATGCGNAAPPAAPGFQVTPYATGFIAQQVFFGDVNFGCPGAYGMAFDKAGNLYVTYFPTGDIYKFPPGGGVADASTLLTTTALGPALSGLVFDKAGNLFASRDATTGNFTTGAVFQIDPANGTILRTVASDLTCPTALSVDPLSGDLFTDDSCSGAGSDNPAMWRIAGPDSATPKTTVYANMPGTPNANISFAPSGTIYAWAISGTAPRIAQVSGTNGPVKPTVSILPNIQLAALGMLASGTQANGDAQTLFLNPFDAILNQAWASAPPTSPPTRPAPASRWLTDTGANNMIFGPDGCVYAAQGDVVYKITANDGSCDYAAAVQPATLTLTPVSVSPNPARALRRLSPASFHYISAPAGTPVFFQVTGANSQATQDGTRGRQRPGQPSAYTAQFNGVDTIVASATLGHQSLSSNQAVINWTAGQHTSFLSLNLSPDHRDGGQTGYPRGLAERCLGGPGRPGCRRQRPIHAGGQFLLRQPPTPRATRRAA